MGIGSDRMPSMSDPDRANECIIVLDDVPVPLLRFDGTRLVQANAPVRSLLGLPPEAAIADIAGLLDPDGSLLAQTLADPSMLFLRAGADGVLRRLRLRTAATFPQGCRLVAIEDAHPQYQVELQLQRRMHFERLLSNAATTLIRATPAKLDDALCEALGAIGMFFGVDRAYVFLIDEAAGTQSNSHEWVANGISREAANLQGVPLDTFPWLLEQLRADRVLRIASLDRLPPEARNERMEFEREGIQSILVVPMWHAGVLHGFVGFDAVRKPLRWDEHYVIGLRLLSQMLAATLAAHRGAGAVLTSPVERRHPG